MNITGNQQKAVEKHAKRSFDKILKNGNREKRILITA
jgi:hypothetical protein